MTRDRSDLIARKMRQARRLHDAAMDHYATGDELLIECQRLVDDVAQLQEGKTPLPRPQDVLPDLRH